MAFTGINISPLLKPWLEQGLPYLLQHEDVPPELSLCHKDAQKTAAPSRSIAGQTEAKAPYQQAPPKQQRPSSAPSPSANAAPRPASSSTAAPPPHSGHEQKLQGAPFLPPQHWPEPWQARLQATRKGHILWTYGNLAADFCGEADATRRAFIHKLLTDLRCPTGTHTFWPPTMPESLALDKEAMVPENFVPHAQAFWSGAHILQAKALVVMGQSATKAIGLPHDIRPFMQIRYNGHFVVVLRDVDLLINEPARYNSVLEFLRTSLAPYV